MSMEASEEAVGANSSNNSNSDDRAHVVVKGKRTKRQRHHHSPAGMASSTSSAEFSGSTTEEEEDMANCLILLAQGQALDTPGWKLEEGGGGERFTSRKFAEAARVGEGKAGIYVYECKTCNKRFPSFQALGGHRASHKRPKTANVAALEDKKAVEEDYLQISIGSFPKPAAMNSPHGSSSNSKLRVHECSICGSEFSSGQALGGHMRRHRSAIMPEIQEVKKEKNILSLDLNLPAPSEDDRGDFAKSPKSNFAFDGKQPLLFSASALVDCHY